jgi:hypothetical protein
MSASAYRDIAQNTAKQTSIEAQCEIRSTVLLEYIQSYVAKYESAASKQRKSRRA